MSEPGGAGVVVADSLVEHGISPTTFAQVFDRVQSSGYERWQDQIARTGHCARPLRLAGRLWRGDQVVFDSDHEPDGVLLKACGNRRRSVCPSCSWTYAGDVWQMLAAGIEGGRKGVPTSVASHPMVFATLTAPSFGRVHGTRDNGAVCTMRGLGVCEHGRKLSCWRHHHPDDEKLGEPLCLDCYDHERQVLFNWCASELWRRFRVYLRRLLARRLGITDAECKAQIHDNYAKVAEFQARGVVHFHAIIRLDGLERDEPPGLTVDTDPLTDAIRDAVNRTWMKATTSAGDEIELRFGSELDIQPINHDDPDGFTPTKAAAYIAKYATKATDDFGLYRPVTRQGAADLGASEHVQRLVAACEHLADTAANTDPDYAAMRACTHQFGWHGHFSTKSRQFSVTLGSIRQERQNYRRHQAAGHRHDEPNVDPDVLVDDDERAEWTFLGVGHTTSGDALLAASAADRARQWRRLGREARREKQAA